MKYFLSILVLFLLPVNLNACNRNNDLEQSNSNFKSTTIGDKKASNFTLKSIDGKEIKLSDYQNKIVLLDFWATWCGPCRKGIPDLISIQNEFKNEVVVIGISLDNESTKDDVKPFMKEIGINYPIVYSDDKVVNDYGGIQFIPTSFIIDRKGYIADQHVGLVAKDVLITKIKELIK